jgi:hypothetical protein
MHMVESESRFETRDPQRLLCSSLKASPFFAVSADCQFAFCSKFWPTLASVFHMKKTLQLLFVLLISVPALAQLEQENISYRDQAGSPWVRSLVFEKISPERTLLLAIDHPVQNDSYWPRVVFRKSFDQNHFGDMNLAAKLLREPQSANAFSANEFRSPAVRSKQPIWESQKSWTLEEEKNYNQWVHDFVRTDLLLESGVKVDCADFAVALRWIYSHDHGLPVGNSLSGSLIGSWSGSSEWDSLPTNPDWKKDQRFKAALRYVLSSIYTHSVHTDLYPVQINPEMITSGTVYLTLFKNSGHTRTIVDIGTNGVACEPGGNECISMIFGDEPAQELAFISQLVPVRTEKSQGGLLRFRWPTRNAAGNWSLVPAPQMPGYSLEQYQWSEADYLLQFSERLGIWQTVEERYLMAGRQAGNSIRFRSGRVAGGYFYCSLIKCQPGSALYEEWSTPQTDHTLETQLAAFRILESQLSAESPARQQLQTELSDIVLGTDAHTVYQMLTTLSMSQVSSDPRADVQTRWGLKDLNATQKAGLISDVLYSNSWLRFNLVKAALDFCHPNRTHELACNPKDPHVKNLNTERLDRAFKLADLKFLELFQLMPLDQQTHFHSFFATVTAFSVAADGAEQWQNYSMEDLIFAHPEIIERMSSKPEDIEKARWGLN